MRNLKAICDNVYTDSPLVDWGTDRDWCRMGNENGECILKPFLYTGEPADENSLSEWESKQTERVLINPVGNKKVYKNSELTQKFMNDKFVFIYTPSKDIIPQTEEEYNRLKENDLLL